MKYIIYKDYMTDYIIDYSYCDVEANNAFELLSEAEKIWNEESTNLYLLRIMVKVGKAESVEEKYGKGWKRQLYKAVLCKRSRIVGWHNNTFDCGESDHYCERIYKGNLSYIKIVDKQEIVV